MESSDARRDATRRFHSDRGRDGADPSARRMGAAPGGAAAPPPAHEGRRPRSDPDERHRRRRRAPADPIWRSVNPAARQLTHRALVEIVKNAIAETGIEASRLKLEITESMIMADSVAAVGALEQLK